MAYAQEKQWNADHRQTQRHHKIRIQRGPDIWVAEGDAEHCTLSQTLLKVTLVFKRVTTGHHLSYNKEKEKSQAKKFGLREEMPRGSKLVNCSFY